MVNWGAAETFRVSEQQLCLLALPQVPCCQKKEEKKSWFKLQFGFENSELKEKKQSTTKE